MFKGLSGLKKVVKGGISAVAEHSSDLAEKVISDPATSQGHLKDTLKQKVAEARDLGENIGAETQAIEKAEEVKHAVHRFTHYGALGEDLLGYEDPNKSLRKAVKEKEKAAKKARKAKKKKTGKKEDLFDPENLKKYAKELEERKQREAEFAEEKAKAEAEEAAAAAAAVEEAAAEAEEKREEDLANKSPDIKFNLDLVTGSGKSSKVATPLQLQSPLTPQREPTEALLEFQNLLSGVDLKVQKKKDALEELKVDSYYQRKKTAAELEEEGEDSEGGVDEANRKEKRRKKKKKKWVDLDQAGFDDFDGSVSGSDSSEAEGPDATEAAEQQEDQEQDKPEEEEEKDENDIGLVEIPEDDPIDLDEEEDLFNTDFVTPVLTGDIKLAVIPDDPKYDDEDDPFNTEYASVIVNKEKDEKRKEANRIKFEGLSSVADVLTGKAATVDKHLIEHSTKRKRRRANRINLIGEQADDLTAREDIGFLDINKDSDQKDILTSASAGGSAKKEKKAEDAEDGEDEADTAGKDQLDVEVGDLLTCTPSPLPTSPAAVVDEKRSKNKEGGAFDLSEFETIDKDGAPVALTSNVAILAGEFSKPVEEEEDDFDAAFDALAQESVTKSKLEELEREFEEADVFDTSNADKVLNLASLANQIEIVEEPLETFEDKDPFDTSAYEFITNDLETDLDFDSLAKRDPEAEAEEEKDKENKKPKDEDDFSGWDEVKPIVDQGWAAFEEKKEPAKKPTRPPPPKPRPPRPPKSQQHHLNPLSDKDAPSVVVNAPSLESIKSWNCATADILIKKSEIEALEAEDHILHEEDEEDPFDTGFADEVLDKEEDVDDPFDLSGFKSPEPEPLQKKDLLSGDLDEDEEAPAVGDAPIIAPVTVKEVDPFDTGFADEVLPDKGDPFDTSYIKGGPGKAELRALEEELLDKDDFDPRLAEGSSLPQSKALPGVGGRARPKGATQQGDLEIKAPETKSDDEEDVDPFDTSIVDKVLPVRKAKKSEVSVEDEDFDPTNTFLSTKEDVDPFDTSIAGQVIPELADKEEPKTPSPEPEPEPEPEQEVEQEEQATKEELAPPQTGSESDSKTPSPTSRSPLPPVPMGVDEIKKKYGRQRPKKPLPRQLTDEDFDPRA